MRPMHALDRLETGVARILEAVAVVLMAVLVAVIAYSVFGRQVLKLSVAWSEEVATALLMWMILLGAAATWSKRRHIAIDVLLRRVGLKARYALSIAIELGSMLLFALIFVGGVEMMSVSANNSTTALGISFTYLYLAIAVSLGAMLLFSGFHLLRLVVRGPAMVALDRSEDEWTISSSS